MEKTGLCTMYLIVSPSFNWSVSWGGCRERCVRLSSTLLGAVRDNVLQG